MKTFWLNDWSAGREDYRNKHELEAMIDDFEIEMSELEGAEILLASYTYEDYSGDAFVLFKRDGKLYEVNGGHCSCYGLEEQWIPEETTAKVLWHRLEKGDLGTHYGESEFKKELHEVLTVLYPKDSETTE